MHSVDPHDQPCSLRVVQFLRLRVCFHPSPDIDANVIDMGSMRHIYCHWPGSGEAQALSRGFQRPYVLDRRCRQWGLRTRWLPRRPGRTFRPIQLHLWMAERNARTLPLSVTERSARRAFESSTGCSSMQLLNNVLVHRHLNRSGLHMRHRPANAASSVSNSPS